MAEFPADPNMLPMLKGVPLIGFRGKNSIAAESLWQDKPCLVMVVRRPGCSLCRAQAKELADQRAKLKELGVRLVAVSHQDDSAADFVDLYFGRDDDDVAGEFKSDSLYLDATKTFYKALGKGNVRKLGFWGVLSSKMWSNSSSAGKMGVQGNYSGDYSHLGGVMLIGKGEEGVLWSFQEVNFGDRAPIPNLLQACTQAVAK